MLVTPSGTLSDVNLKQPEKACFFMLFSRLLSPKMIEVKPLHPEKALSPMLVIVCGNVIDVKPVQPKNAEFPMLVTVSGMIIEVIPGQFANAEFPMLFTGRPSYDSGIKMFLSLQEPIPDTS